jgi:hypothetical protein
LYQAPCRPAKLSILRAWFWPWESWEKKLKKIKKNLKKFKFILLFLFLFFVSSLLSPGQALSTESLVLALGKLGKKKEK